jgi:hypothetical protein
LLTAVTSAQGKPFMQLECCTTLGSPGAMRIHLALCPRFPKCLKPMISL